LFAGEPIPSSPQTLGGKMVAVFIMFMGLTIFAMFTGTVSAFMVERLQMENQTAEMEPVENHVIVCGWNRKAELVLTEYQAAHLKDDTPMVVVAEFDGNIPTLNSDVARRVRWIDDDFTRVSALERACVYQAHTCIILADTRGGRSEQDADARTILAALTVEKLKSDVYTCAELHQRSYGSHLEMGHVNDYVVTGEHSAFLLAQAAMNRGLMDVVGELLTHQRGNQFYRTPLPEKWIGKDFLDLFIHMKRQHNCVLVAVRSQEGELHVNPQSHEFAAGDDIVFIAENETTLTSD